MQFQSLSKYEAQSLQQYQQQQEQRQQYQQQPYDQTSTNNHASSALYSHSPIDQSFSQSSQPINMNQSLFTNGTSQQNVLLQTKNAHDTHPHAISNQPSTIYVSQSQNQPQTQTPPLPSLNDIKDDRDAAKSFIDAINALVQNNNNTVNGTQSCELPPTASFDNTSNNQNGNFMNVNADVYLNGDYPESIPSSFDNGMVLCAPVTMDMNSSSHGVQSTATIATSAITNSIGVKICRIEGCNTEALSRRPYCSRHSGNRLCEYKGGCTKCAQGATRFCIAHGGGRRCTYQGCDKGARDKFYCAAHGGGKRCSKDYCNKSAVGGSTLCTSHGGGRRCSVNGCEKSAQSSTKFCVKHGGGKKCAHQDCDKVARGRTMYCAGHGGGVRCKLEGCTRIAIGKMQLCRTHGGGSSRSKAKFGSESSEIATTTLDGNPTGFGQPMASSPLSVYLNESQGYYGVQPPTAGTGTSHTMTHL